MTIYNLIMRLILVVAFAIALLKSNYELATIAAIFLASGEIVDAIKEGE